MPDSRIVILSAACLLLLLQEATAGDSRTSRADYDNIIIFGPVVLVTLHQNDTISIEIERDSDNVLKGLLGVATSTRNSTDCDSDLSTRGGGVCLQWDSGPRLEIYYPYKNNFINVSGIECITVNWTMGEAPSQVTETPEDCYDMTDDFWYGGFEHSYQTWPINDFPISSLPYITGDAFHNIEYGDVIEGIFISSSGVGIYVDEATPLYLSINSDNSKRLCLKGKIGSDTPFFQYDQPHLRYDICKSDNITSLWKGMSQLYIPKPQSYPSPDVLRRPIWTTWATYKGLINQTTIVEFAETIRSNNFSISQLEIDDEWTPHYGDFTFDTKMFPDAKKMIEDLTKLGIPTAFWVHWFINDDADSFPELSNAGYLLKESNSDAPVLVSWWRGSYAGVLDFTNPGTVAWYLGKLEDLRTKYNVTSFKFDAGEIKWLKGKHFKTNQTIPTPNYLSKRYAEAAYLADTVERRQELRTGFRSQAASNMVRMLDRDSNWSHNLGIKTLIPCALVFGLMGYPYVLPDIIGGNAYDSGDIDITTAIEPELYIRWVQVSALLPVLQFSVVPWAYKNSSVVEITQKYIDLHEKYADKIIDLAKKAQQTGEPIVRPLWWIAPNDKDALTLDTEFLVGNDLLVAPVLEQGARSRDIYLPLGTWHDELRNVDIKGGTWLKDYKADLDELPYFTKVD